VRKRDRERKRLQGIIDTLAGDMPKHEGRVKVCVDVVVDLIAFACYVRRKKREGIHLADEFLSRGRRCSNRCSVTANCGSVCTTPVRQRAISPPYPLPLVILGLI
jgi:hypothetical protein